MTALADLRTRLAEISDLGYATAVLDWDQQVLMPRDGAAGRAEQLATLQRLAHERFVDDHVGELLESAADEVGSLPPDHLDAALVRVARRDYDKAVRVPSELAAELSRAASLGHHAWDEARRNDDFAHFLPALQRNVELKRQYAACFPEFALPYDALLDDFEQGMTAAEVTAVFDELKAGLVPFIAELAARPQVDGRCLTLPVPQATQEAFVREVLTALGYETGGWRLDVSAHPFSTNFGLGDLRITTRYDEGYWPTALYGGLHETGHGLYEQGSAKELERTPLCGGVSLGIHESQSRLWENQVGRGRAFVGWLAPQLRAAYGEAFADVSDDELHRAVNRVQPSLIRVEADEATYSLHVILRFELEQAMLDGSVALADLPEAWNQKVRDYLGIEVPNDREGVLQDVHWSAGLIGYFPTYALGSIASAQIWDAAARDLPDLDAQLARGECAPLREWLREHLHRLGRTLTPRETLQHVVGSSYDVAPYLAYLRGKLGPIYGL